MRSMRSFSLADMHKFNRDTVKGYVKCLEAGGFLERVEEGRFRRTVYQLVRDEGVEAPRLRADGTPTKMGLARDHMWRAMKMLGRFTYVDLAVSASTEDVPVNEMDAKDYVKHLLAAGYLTILVPATPRSKAEYRLTRNTGPMPPMVTRAKVVFDPNLGRIAWSEEIDA